jgi:hypothetical protein
MSWAPTQSWSLLRQALSRKPNKKSPQCSIEHSNSIVSTLAVLTLDGNVFGYCLQQRALLALTIEIKDTLLFKKYLCLCVKLPYDTEFPLFSIHPIWMLRPALVLQSAAPYRRIKKGGDSWSLWGNKRKEPTIRYNMALTLLSKLHG